MNHTQRIAHVARQRRKLTKAMVKEAVELYLEALADEIASGEWVDIKGIGKIQIIQEKTDLVLTSYGKSNTRVKNRITRRLRTRFRLYRHFKDRCHENIGGIIEMIGILIHMKKLNMKPADCH